MFKKLFKFGKKKQEEANDNEVVNEHDTAIEENNDNVNESKQEDIAVSNEDVVEEKVENEETKDLENSDVSETIESVEEKLDLIELYKGIHKLDKKTKEVFYLRIKGELSFKEIGEITEQSEQWARTIFYRGKLKIKEDILKNEK